MIKFHMDFFDVLFPLKMGVLTYRCPEKLSGRIKPGMIVSVALKNRPAKGIVFGRAVATPRRDIKDIQGLQDENPVFGEGMLDLLRWMSDYYLTEKGLVLKTMLPKEAFTRVKRRLSNAPRVAARPLSLVETDAAVASALAETLCAPRYKTFLLHAPSSSYENSVLLNILPGVRNGIILAPEVSIAENLYPALRERLGARIVLFHGELSRGKKSEALANIISGRADIILGTRSAVFSPLNRVSFIAVLQEHSKSYKQESVPCYNARDVAVMRGYLEKAVVLLSSICPSMESVFNCKTGKYTLLKPTMKMEKPRVRLVDMKHGKMLKPYLSKTVMDAAAGHLGRNENVMFVINRRGYALLQCGDCGNIEKCPFCSIPLVFHKYDMSMKCHYCAYALADVPQRCSSCHGYGLKLLGAGTQKAQEDIEELLKIKTLRLDSDGVGRKTFSEGAEGSGSGHERRIIVSTKLMSESLGRASGFSMAAVLNTDILLNIPDFRSAEKAYQEISSVLDAIEPGGELLIQTRMPWNYLFQSLKHCDYAAFLREELDRRKSLAYPPYSRLLLIKFISKRDIAAELSRVLAGIGREPEILGPYARKDRRSGNELRLLLKSSARENLQSAAKIFIEAFRGSRDVNIRVDVDPIAV